MSILANPDHFEKGTLNIQWLQMTMKQKDFSEVAGHRVFETVTVTAPSSHVSPLEGGHHGSVAQPCFNVEHTNMHTKKVHIFQSKETENGIKQFTPLCFSVLSAL